MSDHLTDEQLRALEHERTVQRRHAHRMAAEARLQGDGQALVVLRRGWLPVLRDPRDHRAIPDESLFW